MKNLKSNPDNTKPSCTASSADTTQTKEQKSETVSVRLPSSLLEAIDKHRKPWKVSRGQWVRAAVQQQLDQAEAKQVLDDLLREAKTLRRNHARALLCILTLLGDIPAEEAQEHVRRVMIS